ncbi:MAG: CoA transferase [Actinomycetes bacterium]
MKYLRDCSPELQQLQWLASEFESLSGLAIDPRELLAQRVRHTGWQASPSQSVGGSCHLMLTSDEHWVAINLARPEDHELVGIFFSLEVGADEKLDIGKLRNNVRSCTSAKFIEYAIDVGLPIAVLDEVSNKYARLELPLQIQNIEKTHDFLLGRPLKVVDLSSLWAGPLCSQLLQQCGYSVTKVESRHRPDGARYGNPNFFAELDAGKNHIEIDFHTEHGINQLCELIESADVVIEGSRPRAMQQLGINAEQIVRQAQPRVWLSITGYGRAGVAGQRVGFGDDCAIAGGLVAYSPDGPQFLGDAIADPISGLVAATSILRAIDQQKSCLIGVSLAESAAWLNSVRKKQESQRDFNP